MTQTATSSTRQRTRSCAVELRCHRCDISYPLAESKFVCPDCGKGLDIDPLRLRAGGRVLPRDPARRAAEEHLAVRGAAADRRRGSPGARRPVLRTHAADARRAARRRAGNRQPLHQGRIDGAPVLVVQEGPGVLDGRRAAARARSQRDRLCLQPATSARPSLRFAPLRGSRPTFATRTGSSKPRHGSAARSAPVSSKSRATTTKPTGSAARSPKRPASSGRTSRCARSTPRARRPPRSRSSSSWA